MPVAVAVAAFAVAGSAVAIGACGDGDRNGIGPTVSAGRMSAHEVTLDLLAPDSPLAVDPAATDTEVQCVAEQLLADLGPAELLAAGFDGDGVLGRAYHDWAFSSLPPRDEVHAFWDAIFSCVDGATFVERQAGLSGAPSDACIVERVLSDDEVRLMLVYGVRPGAEHGPMGVLHDWLQRYDVIAHQCGVTPPG